MRIALIMNRHAYPGREYLSALLRAAIDVDVLSIGEYPETNPVEEARCGGLWRPSRMAELSAQCRHYEFDSLKDVGLLTFLESSQYDLGLQGGTGILRSHHLEPFRIGVLNFHPGDLPEYRGCSAPEWQLRDGRKVVSTCHLIDEGIDSGPIVGKRELNLDLSRYDRMRAGVYPETAQFVVAILADVMANGSLPCVPVQQDETKARYRNRMSSELVDDLARVLARGMAS